MNFKGKQLGLFLIGLVLFIGLAACGSDKKTSSGDGDGDGKVTLELWHTWTEDRPENKIYKDRVETFNKEHSDIEVKLEGVPNDDIETKLRTQATADKLPDMFKGYSGERMQNFIDSEKVMPIDDIMDTWKDKIPDELMQGFNFDGKQYAIPGDIAVSSLVYYDKQKLKDAGYDEFPEKYDDLKDLIKKLNADDVTPISLGNKAPWVLQSCYISSIGDRATGSDFLEKAMNGDAKFTDDQFVKGLSVIEDLSKLKAFNENFNTIDEEKSRNNFIDGKSAMHIAGSWALGPILDDAKDIDNIGVAAFPTLKDGDGDADKVSGTVGNGIYLNNKLSGKKKEAAESFLKFFYDDDMYEELAEKANLLVPTDVDTDEVSDLFANVNTLTDNGLAPVYDATLTPELTDEINKGLQSITTDSITPEKLAKNMQDINEED